MEIVAFMQQNDKNVPKKNKKLAMDY